MARSRQSSFMLFGESEVFLEEKASIKGRVLTGLFWKLMENGGVQVVQFVISIVLARILDPEEYGLIGLIMIFITFGNVFIQQGFGTALVQKKDADDIDFSSVFWVNLGVSVLLYIVLFFAAPFVAAFYDRPQLEPVLRVFAFVLIIGSFNAVQNALLTRRMDFRHLFISSLTAVLASGAVGIVMAKTGFGVWALVGQQLSYQIFYSIIIVLTVHWVPRRIVDRGRVGGLFSFGWKMLASALIDNIYTSFYGLVIGKIYNPDMLAYYNQGNVFPQTIIGNVNSAIQQVMLPALSENQDDKERMKAMTRRSIVTSSFIIFPMMAGLMAVAEPMVRLILTDKWLPCVPFLRLLCLSFALWPIHTANLQAISASGHSEIYLKLEIIKFFNGLAFMLLGMPFGIYVMVGLKVVSSFIAMLVNIWPNRRILNYSASEQLKDVLPSALLSVVMGVLVYLISLTHLPLILMLVVQILAGVAIYTALAAVFKLECFRYLVEVLLGILKKKRIG